MKTTYIYIKTCLFSSFLILQTTFAIYSQQAPFASFNSTSGSYIDFGRGLNLNCFNDLSSGNKITIAMWVRWSDKNAAGVGEWANLVTMADSTGSGDNGVFWVQHSQTNSKFEFAINTTSRDYLQSNTTPLNNVWYHVAMVYDGSLASGNMKIYVNGVLDNSRNKTGNIRTFPSPSRLNFGRWPNAGNNYRRFNGKMDEVSVWKRALTVTEIQNMMISPETVTGVAYDDASLLGFWNFDNYTADDLGSCRNNGFVGTGVVLPVNLISFSGTPTEKGIQLTWATSSEINNSHFLIQRSSDGNEFITIGQIVGAGQSNRLLTYTLLDESPLDNYNYYRLIQVDFDGKQTVSNIISVGFQTSMDSNIKVYPNPTNIGNIINVGIENGKGAITISIISSSGKLIETTSSNENIINIPTIGMESGLYILQILTNGETTYKKVLITD